NRELTYAIQRAIQTHAVQLAVWANVRNLTGRAVGIPGRPIWGGDNTDRLAVHLLLGKPLQFAVVHTADRVRGIDREPYAAVGGSGDRGRHVARIEHRVLDDPGR